MGAEGVRGRAGDKSVKWYGDSSNERVGKGGLW